MSFGMIVVAIVAVWVVLMMYVSFKRKRSDKHIGLIPKGWEVVEDVEPTPDLDISKLKPRSFFKDSDKNGYISGEEMRKRAQEFKGNLGLSDGKRMLAEQDKIPPEFRSYIPLPGALVRDSDGKLRVPCLGWSYDHRWVLYFDFLSNDWFESDHFACNE